MSQRNSWIVAFAVSWFLIGCSDPETGGGTKGVPTIKTPPPDTMGTSAHVHAEKGPHGGTLIELGGDAYHAELMREGDAITIYILDGNAKSTVPIDATEVVINLKYDGVPQQLKLAASPAPRDPAGKSSRFSLTDADLAKHVGSAAAEAKLGVTIAGKPYRGEIGHSHRP